MARYVALLRGINVGGRNLVGMPALKALIEEECGCTDVATYIQSGNVIFTSKEKRTALVARIERELSTAFSHEATIVLRSLAEMRRIVEGAPAGFGRRPALYRYDVVFLKDPLSAATALRSVTIKPGVDQAVAGSRAIYFSRLIARASESQLGRLISTPIYKKLTIRNWNTTSRLLELLSESAGGRGR
jgi:uncharacterized protein (DUF1697 family)